MAIEGEKHWQSGGGHRVQVRWLCASVLLPLCMYATAHTRVRMHSCACAGACAYKCIDEV